MLLATSSIYRPDPQCWEEVKSEGIVVPSFCLAFQAINSFLNVASCQSSLNVYSEVSSHYQTKVNNDKSSTNDEMCLSHK